MPMNTHAVAYQAVGKHFSTRLPSYKNPFKANVLATQMQITSRDAFIGMETLGAFFSSTSRQIDADHAELALSKGGKVNVHPNEISNAVDVARKMWRLMNDASGKFVVPHDA